MNLPTLIKLFLKQNPYCREVWERKNVIALSLLPVLKAFAAVYSDTRHMLVLN